MSTLLKSLVQFGLSASPPVGQTLYDTPGSYTFTVPEGVETVSVVCVGGGGNAVFNYWNSDSDWQFTSGGGGALAYVNGVSVTPGQTFSVTVGAQGQNSSFGSVCVAGGANGASGGSVITGTGGSGGSGGANETGAGAGGYAGAGGGGVTTQSTSFNSGLAGAGGGGASGLGFVGQNVVTNAVNRVFAGAGGGVGIYGQGANGQPNGGGGSGGTSGQQGGGFNAGSFGGGGGYESDVDSAFSVSQRIVGSGATGAVRIIWPGLARQFPSTVTEDL